MSAGKNNFRLPLGFALATLLLTAPLFAAGFGIFEQGTKAMGMAGAFTAQADDPSAMFYNVGGLAFQKERDFLLGFTYITSGKAEFTGKSTNVVSLPLSGPVGGGGGETFFQTFPYSESRPYRAEQETLSEIPPHFYWVEPINDKWSFGLAVNAPFGLSTEWKDPENFLGRHVSTMAALTGIDLNPNIAYKVSDTFGIGFGAIIRFSDLELKNSSTVSITDPSIIDPLTGEPREFPAWGSTGPTPPFPPFAIPPIPNTLGIDLMSFADARVQSDTGQGYGFQIGILHKIRPNVSWGLSYRSKVTVDYEGTADISRTSFGDFLAGAGLLPLPPQLSAPVKTKIEFPDMASLGIAFGVSSSVLVEADFNWTGWSSFESLKLTSTVPGVGFERLEDWDDAYNYRVGVNWKKSSKTELRFGYVFDESPQPTASVSPLLPGSDRNGFTFGWGMLRDKFSVDLAVMYLIFDDREVLQSQDGFNGTYEQQAWLLGASFGF